MPNPNLRNSDRLEDSDPVARTREPSAPVNLGRRATDRATTAVACARCFAPVPQSARFCAFCGTPVASADAQAERPVPAARIERRRLVVMFCDLVGSVGLANALDPEDFTAVIRGFQRSVAAVVAAHGGVVARRLGDGTLVYFGYPTAEEDDAERAVRAALALVDALAGLTVAGTRLQVRVGAAAGVAIVGDVSGTGAADGLDIAGEAPNLAARLQALAMPNSVLVSEELRLLAGQGFRWRDLGARALKGWDAPVPVWELAGAKRDLGRAASRHRAVPLPMVGRQQASARLGELWRAAQAGRGAAVVVAGEAGIGKSRLVGDLLRRSAGDRHARLRYGCAPTDRDAPLGPLLRHLRSFVGFDPADDAEARQRKLRAALSATPEPDLALVAALLLAPLPNQPGIAELAPHRRRERTLEALYGLLARLAQAQPMLVVFEDAHWADPMSRELLALVARRAPELPVLVVVTMRPEGTLDGIAERIDLTPLDGATAAELIGLASADGPALAPDTVAEIVRRADGVPLYLEELTRAVQDGRVGAGAADRTFASAADRTLASAADRTLAGGAADRTSADGVAGRAAAGSARPGAVPASIHVSLQARLDRLGPLRGAAEAAATIGREFSAELLGAVAELTPTARDNTIQHLVEAGLLQRIGPSDAGTYRFRHSLFRDAAYGGMLRPRRAALHGRVADVLVARSAGPGGAEPFLVAQHYTEAGRAEPAARWWLRAGLQSLQQSGVAEAAPLLQRGLDLLQSMPAGEARLRLELDLRILQTKCLFATVGWAAEATGDALRRARDVCEVLGTPPQLRSVLFGQWTHDFLRGELQAALAGGQAILAVGTERDDADWRVVGDYCIGMTQHSLGNFHLVREHLGRGIEAYDPARRDLYAGPVVAEPRVVMRTYLSWALLCTGAYDAAWRHCLVALDDARATQQGLALAHVLFRHAYHSAFAISIEAGLAAMEPLFAHAGSHGLLHYQALGMVQQGWCQGLAGDPGRGLATLRAGLAGYGRIGTRLYLPTFYRMEAEVMGHAGDFAGGLARVEEAGALAQRTNEAWDDAEIARVRGGLLERGGDRAGAEAAYRTAMALAERRGADWFGLRAATSLALLLEADSPREAAGALRPFLARCAGTRHSADVATARSVLARLPAGPEAVG